MAKNLGFNLPKKLSPEVAKLMRELVEGESPDVPKRLEALSEADRLAMIRTLTGEVSKLIHKFDAMHRDERKNAIDVSAAVVAGLLGDSDAEAVAQLLMKRTQKQKRLVHCKDLTTELARFLRKDARWKSRETFERRYPEFSRK